MNNYTNRTWAEIEPGATERLTHTVTAADIEAGNMIAKQLTYLVGADSAGILLGTRVPIVLTSRADSVRVRLASTAVMKLEAHELRARRADVP